jgi:hypothetical protein
LVVPVTTPAAVAGSTTAKEWNFLPVSRALDNPKTFTIEVGDASAADRFVYGQLTTFTADLSQDEMKVSGNLIARAQSANISLTASPTIVPERPVERGQVDVFIDPTFGAIGSTKITNCFEENFSLGEKYKAKFIHDSTVPSFQDTTEVAPTLTFSFTQEHDTQSRARLASILAADPIQYLRIRCKGIDLSTLQDGSVTELIQIDVAGKFTEPEEVRDVMSMGVYGYKYTFVALDDPTMGRPFSVKNINTLTTL